MIQNFVTRYFISLVLLFVCQILTSSNVAQAGDLELQSRRGEPRPFRAGLLRLSPAFDNEKTLGLSDGVGWTSSGELLIGAPQKFAIAAFSSETGSAVWWNTISTPATSPAAAFNEHVVIGLRSGAVQKLEAATGKKIWEAQLDTFTERTPILTSNILLIYTTTQLLYALDFETGKTLWLYDAGFPDGMTVRPGSAPIVHESDVIFGTAAGEIQAVNLQAGRVTWRYNPSFKESRFHDVVGQLVIKDGHLLVTRYDGLLVAIDLATAAKQDFRNIWSDEVTSITTGVFRDGRYYVGCLNGDVYAYDSSNGRKIWKAETGQSVSSITPLESNVVVVGTDGRITSLDPTGGTLQWHDDIAAEISTPPVLVKDRLFVATSLRNLYGYRTLSAPRKTDN